MVDLLRRLFIKDYKNVEDPSVRAAHGVMASLFGIFTNIIIVALKLTAAFVLFVQSGFAIFSVALLADSVNNLSDCASSLISLISFKVANKPADEEHPYGHQRSEYIASLIVSIIVCCLAVTLLKDSITGAISDSQVEYDLLTIVILAVSILLKLLQGLFNLRMARLLDSNTLKATALDSFTDTFATSLVLVSAIVYWCTGFGGLDSYMGIAVALFILYAGMKMVKESISPLLGEKPDKKKIDEIVCYVKSFELVKGIHDLIVHDYGPGVRFITLHVEVDEKEDINLIHETIDEIEKGIEEKFSFHASIHMDPVALDDEELMILKKAISEGLQAKDQGLSIHDVRIVRGNKNTNVIFDCLMPYEAKEKETEIKAWTKQILDSIKKDRYTAVITFDRPYV